MTGPHLLTVTSLYPNAAQPNKAIFVENRLRRLVATGQVNARVVAPVPWFPLPGKIFGAYGTYAAIPRSESRHGLAISHPRYAVVPKFGTNWQAMSYTAALTRHLRRLCAAGVPIDLIDAHYMYPDGVAAVRVARQFGLPVTVTCRGTDLNLIANLPGPGKQIRAAFDMLDQLIVVSSALGERARALGMDPEHISVLRNGVDDDVFKPADPSAWRALAPDARATLVSVGNLVPLKGHDLIIRALTHLEGLHLLIAGEGPERAALEQLAKDLGLAGRVHFVGSVPHDELASVYSAADILVLASEREGWPNVLLEAMACGTPVAATAVGGIPEMVTASDAGVLIQERTPDAIAAAINSLLSSRRERDRTRAHAQKFRWDDTITKQAALYHRIVDNHRSQGSVQNQQLRA